MNGTNWVLLANGLSTFYLTGLIWVIQAIHYPAFRFVSKDQFTAFEAFHQRRISPVVAPPMVIELLTSLTLVALRPAYVPGGLVWLGLALTLLIWLSTFALQVPAHQKLSTCYDEAALRRLVATNWLRTAAWTGRAVLCAWLFALGLGSER